MIQYPIFCFISFSVTYNIRANGLNFLRLSCFFSFLFFLAYLRSESFLASFLLVYLLPVWYHLVPNFAIYKEKLKPISLLLKVENIFRYKLSHPWQLLKLTKIDDLKKNQPCSPTGVCEMMKCSTDTYLQKFQV